MKILSILLLLLMSIHLGAEDLNITFQKPQGILKMGDTPVFTSTIRNISGQPIEGIVLYLSLVNLEKGQEYPVDLEDWSAQKAEHFNQLKTGTAIINKWSMRLIQSGHYGIFVTAVLPGSHHPLTSEMVHFDIQVKKTVIPARIWPIAVGMPMLVLFLMGILWYRRK